MKYIFRLPGGDVRWGWKAIILIFGTILFGILLNTVLITVLTIGYSFVGFPQGQALENAMLAASSFIAQVILALFQLGFMFWLVWLLMTRIEKQKSNWSALGLVNKNRSRYILLGGFLAIVLSFLTISVGYFTSTLKYVGNGFALFAPTQVIVTLLLTTILAFASGFGEEIAFRGYLQSRIAQRYNHPIAVAIVAVLFALSHPLSFAANPLLYFATAILVGILFGTIFARTGSLWMGIALHAVWNYMQIAVFVVRASADTRFFGAPLFVFENISGVPQMMVEIGVILIALSAVLWWARPAMKRDTRAYQLK